MKLKKLSKSAAIVMAAAMLTTTAVSAAPDISESIIDTNRTGTIKVVKYVNELNEATDTDPGLGSTAGESSVKHEPLADVTYTIYRVADIVQGHLDSTGNYVSVEYRSLVKDSTDEKNIIPVPSMVKDGQLMAKDEAVAVLNQWVNDLRDSAANEKRASNLNQLPYWSGKTDEDGVVKFENLPLGVYIIYEEEHPTLVTSTQCAVVSLPMTASTHSDVIGDIVPDDDAYDVTNNQGGDIDNIGSYWVYDVQVHPKNVLTQLSVEKHILVDEGETTAADLNYVATPSLNDPTNDVLTDTEDYEIGDTIRYSIQAEVPATIGEIMHFYLEDRLSAGQTFTNDTAGANTIAEMEVWAEPVDGGAAVNIPRVTNNVTNWTVTDPTAAADESQAENDTFGNSQVITDDKASTFQIYFNTQTLSQQAVNDNLDSTKRVALYSKVWVTFNVKLNEDALIGEPGNPNDVALKYSHTTTTNGVEIPNQPNVPSDADEIDTVNPQCIDTRVYTYELELNKKGELDESMQGVEFELRNAKGELIKLTQDEKGYYVDKEKDGDTDVIVIDSNNRTSIRGLDDGTYQLVETKTLDGYNLLKAPVIFTVSSETAVAGEEFTYAQAATPEEGEYFKIEEGKGYYIEQAINDTDTMKVRIDITGHTVGDYISVAEGKDVYSYVLTGDALIDEKMSNQNKLVTTRYEYRWSDAETMNWNSNYGQAGQDGLDDGTFTFTVVNRKGFEIPSTGGMGVMPYILGGGMIVLVGGVGMMKLKKKED